MNTVTSEPPAGIKGLIKQEPEQGRSEGAGPVLVTGCAGFIGQHLGKRLALLGYEVHGVDRVRPKHWTPMFFSQKDVGDLIPADLARYPLVFHLAGRGGVRPSWRAFDAYALDNIAATHHLVSIAKPGTRLVLASSSSVYGNHVYPVPEDRELYPESPYAVSKVAAEHLLSMSDVSPVILRYFTVYGPFQRQDMAFARWVRAVLDGGKAIVYGDGEQIRDFTYIDDAVEATILAGLNSEGVYNVAGGRAVTINEALTMIADKAGREIDIERCPEERGDVRSTCADLTRLKALGWEPKVSLEEGIQRQIRYAS